MITSLEKLLQVINTELLLSPNDLNLLTSQMEVENKLELAKFYLTDVVEVKTTADEGMTFSNAWCTHHERIDHLVRSQGKVYSLVLGQCTTVLLGKMKQDADWQATSDFYDPLKLLKLIEISILKQSDNQYKIGIIIEQLKLLLAYWQDDGVTNLAAKVADMLATCLNNTRFHSNFGQMDWCCRHKIEDVGTFCVGLSRHPFFPPKTRPAHVRM
jgi:hypothetical protein